MRKVETSSRMRYMIPLLLLFFSAIPLAFTQVSVEMEKTWGGTEDEVAHGVTVDKYGNIYVVGQTNSFGQGLNDAFILKYAPDGELLWQKAWGGEKDDIAYGVATFQDVLYIVGETNSFEMSGDAFILKYGSVGNPIWQKSFRPPL